MKRLIMIFIFCLCISMPVFAAEAVYNANTDLITTDIRNADYLDTGVITTTDIIWYSDNVSTPGI